MSEHKWANLIIRAAVDDHAEAIVSAINHEISRKGAGRASVIVACTQILAQDIMQAAGTSRVLPADVRSGILQLIDDFAMRFAVTNNTPDGAP